MTVRIAATGSERRICTRCVMDTSDPEITFDAQGVCSHCHTYDREMARRVPSGPEAEARLQELVAGIRRGGEGREYDCVIGVSGGVDSTYLAFQAKRLGLRPLAVHLDNGWDSELAVRNIEQTLKKLGIDLHTHVIDWNEFRDLQVSFLRASTPDSEIPTDHAILALLGQTALKSGARYVLAGFNARTESHLPRAWSQGYWDWKYVRGIHRRFGSVPLRTYPHLSLMGLAWMQYRTKWINLLDLVDYSKKRAMEILQSELGWKYYGGKHYESIYTRFYQGCILPRKFGFDKRRSHLSSLVCSGEMTRAEALGELAKAPYPPDQQTEDREYVIKKLGLQPADFDGIMAAPPKRFEDYPSYRAGRLYKLLRWVHRSR